MSILTRSVVCLIAALCLTAAALHASESEAGDHVVIQPDQEIGDVAAARARVMAQIEAVPIERFAPATYTHTDGRVLPYRLFTPDDIEPGRLHPLVLFLHGAGGRGDDNVKPVMDGDAFGSRRWATPDAQAAHPCFVLVPQCPAGSRWIAHELDEEDQYEPLLGLLEQMLADLPIDRSRVYVTGLSMGGFASITLVQRRPSQFAAAVSVCGGGDPAIAEQIAHVPIWLLHGLKDRIVSPEHSRSLHTALVEAGARGTLLYEYEGIGHDVWVNAYTEPQMADWLFAQRATPDAP
jgi:predicted peptidase